MGPLQGCAACGRCFHLGCHAEHTAQAALLAERAATHTSASGSGGGAGSGPATPTAASAPAPAARGAGAGRADAGGAAAPPDGEWTCVDCLTAATAVAPAASTTAGRVGVTTMLAQRVPPPGVGFARLRPPPELLVPPGDVSHLGLGERALLTVVHPTGKVSPVQPGPRRALVHSASLPAAATAAGAAPGVSSSAPVSEVRTLYAAAAAASSTAGAAPAAAAGKKRTRPASDSAGGAGVGGSKSAAARSGTHSQHMAGTSTAAAAGADGLSSSAPTTARGGGGADDGAGGSDADDTMGGGGAVRDVNDGAGAGPRAPLDDTIAAAFSRRGGFAVDPDEEEDDAAMAAQRAAQDRVLQAVVQAAAARGAAVAASGSISTSAVDALATHPGAPPLSDRDALTRLVYGDATLPTLRVPDLRRPRVLRVRFVPRDDVQPGASMPGQRLALPAFATAPSAAAGAAGAASSAAAAADDGGEGDVWGVAGSDSDSGIGARGVASTTPSVVVVAPATAPGAPPTPASRTGSAILVDWTDHRRGLVHAAPSAAASAATPAASSASTIPWDGAVSRQASTASAGSGGSSSQASTAAAAALPLRATGVGRGPSLVDELSASQLPPPLVVPVADASTVVDEADDRGSVGGASGSGPASGRHPPPGGSEGGSSELADDLGPGLGKPTLSPASVGADAARAGGGDWQ
jgi:hypothetical protein